MEDNFLSLKTSQTLLTELHRAASVHVSEADVREQKVSFVYALMKNDSGITRDQVRQVISGSPLLWGATA